MILLFPTLLKFKGEEDKKLFSPTLVFTSIFLYLVADTDR